MSKKPIDFSAIDTKVIEQLKKFVAARVAIAKEDAQIGRASCRERV